MTNETIERRFTPLETAEIRAEGDGALPTISGLACPFNSASVELWRDWETGRPVIEMFARGAFSKVLGSTPDIVALRDHDRSLLLGRTKSGTAKVFETERGLEYEVQPPDTTNGRDTVALLRRGDLFGSSFAFIADKVTYDETQKNKIVRMVESVRLLEDVSVVTRAAYPKSKAAASARSIEELQEELNSFRAELAGESQEERRARHLRVARRFAAGL